MTARKLVLASLSAAMDGGFTAIADVSQAMTLAGAEADYRLIGGVTVMPAHPAAPARPSAAGDW